MANISITTVCNARCVYCFTHSVLRTDENRFMHIETFVQALDFLDRSNVDQIRILGGEPTLHPDFILFIETALKRNKEIKIFTNGNIPDNVLEFLCSNKQRNISYLVNLTDSLTEHGTGTGGHSKETGKQLQKTLGRLGEKAMPGINLYRTDQDISSVIPLIEKYHLRKAVRLGIAHPGTDISNSFLHPRQYMQMGKKIAGFAQLAVKEDIRIIPDCGLVPCMFDRETASAIPAREWNIGKTCSPIVDILPDGSIIPCYPLATVCSEKLDSPINLDAAISSLSKTLSLYRNLGIFRECVVCPLFTSGECFGGCRAAAIRRMQKPDFALSL